MVRCLGARAVGVLVEKWDAEDLDAWGQVVGWLKMPKRGLKSWKKVWEVDGMLIEKYLVIRGCAG